MAFPNSQYTTTPPRGTYFEDGVRVGPLFQENFVNGSTAGGIPQVSYVPTAQLNSPQGVKVSALNIYDIIPIPANTVAIAAPQIVPAASYFTLNTQIGGISYPRSYLGVLGCIQITNPSVLTFTPGGTSTMAFLVTGFDTLGNQISETVTFTASAAAQSTVNVYAAVISIRCSSVTSTPTVYVSSAGYTGNITPGQTPVATALLFLTGAYYQSELPFTGGSPVMVMDVPRALEFTAVPGTGATTMVIQGWDMYEQPMTEHVNVAANSGMSNVTTVGNKAFMYVESINSGSGTTANISVGGSDTYGFPYLISTGNYLLSAFWKQASDAGTLVLGSTTNPATATSGDVRGTYTPDTSSAPTAGAPRVQFTALVYVYGGSSDAQYVQQKFGYVQYSGV